MTNRGQLCYTPPRFAEAGSEFSFKVSEIKPQALKQFSLASCGPQSQSTLPLPDRQINDPGFPRKVSSADRR
jgi:hypothetical protein